MLRVGMGMWKVCRQLLVQVKFAPEAHFQLQAMFSDAEGATH